MPQIIALDNSTQNLSDRILNPRSLLLMKCWSDRIAKPRSLTFAIASKT
ncbi:hypothetical protein AB3R30_22965 [Leptolyngbyaceae cyanobacterium UHCC 1019]